MAVVAVIVLIAILFLSGTVMALAVSSSLHTVDITSQQDAIHYAAESAVAQGVAAASAELSPCRVSGSINHQGFTATCEAPLQGVSPNSIQLFSFPGRRIGGSDALNIQLPLPNKWEAIWTVVGWRTTDGSPAVTAWIDNGQDCGQRPSAPSASPVYLTCRSDNDGNGDQSGSADSTTALHILVSGGSVDLGGFVVRAALKGSGQIVTVVGKSGFEVDEADVAVPDRAVKLWNTVLP